MSLGDLAAAGVLAALVVVFASCFWPGFARLDSAALRGHWRAQDGTLLRLEPDGRRTFTATAGPGGEKQEGALRALRAVRLSGGRRGRVAFGGRRVAWEGGGAWVRQGLSGPPAP